MQLSTKHPVALFIEKILIADDHELIMMGTSTILRESFDIGEIVMLTSPEEVINLVNTRNFDVYILDLEFKESSGFNLVKQIRKKHADARIIINTMHEEIWNVNQLLELNVNGIILKRSSREHLTQAVVVAMQNKQFLCPRFEELKGKCPDYKQKLRTKNSCLTKTETRVLKYIVEGHTSKSIADTMHVSEDTIEVHRKNLFIKLEAKNVAHLVSIAIRQRLVE